MDDVEFLFPVRSLRGSKTRFDRPRIVHRSIRLPGVIDSRHDFINGVDTISPTSRGDRSFVSADEKTCYGMPSVLVNISGVPNLY